MWFVELQRMFVLVLSSAVVCWASKNVPLGFIKAPRCIGLEEFCLDLSFVFC